MPTSSSKQNPDKPHIERRETFEHSLCNSAFFIPETGKLFFISKIQPTPFEAFPDSRAQKAPLLSLFLCEIKGLQAPAIRVSSGVVIIHEAYIDGTKRSTSTKEKFVSVLGIRPGLHYELRHITEDSVIDEVILYPGEAECPEDWKTIDEVVQMTGYSKDSIKNGIEKVNKRDGLEMHVKWMRPFRSPETGYIRTYLHPDLIQEISTTLAETFVKEKKQQSEGMIYVKDLAAQVDLTSQQLWNLIKNKGWSHIEKDYKKKHGEKVESWSVSDVLQQKILDHIEKHPRALKGWVQPESLAKELGVAKNDVYTYKRLVWHSGQEAPQFCYTNTFDKPTEHWSPDLAQDIRRVAIRQTGSTLVEVAEKHQLSRNDAQRGYEWLRDTHPNAFSIDVKTKTEYLSIRGIAEMLSHIRS